jgi:hypothetical protein
MARHQSDLKQRELALRTILYESLTLTHNSKLESLSAEQVVEKYKTWRIKAGHVLEATRRRGER